MKGRRFFWQFPLIEFWDLIIISTNFYLCNELSDLPLGSVLSWCLGALILQGCDDEWSLKQWNESL